MNKERYYNLIVLCTCEMLWLMVSCWLFVGRDVCDLATQFDCTQMSSSNCISLTAVCDGRRDCHGDEDENSTLCATRLQHSQ